MPKRVEGWAVRASIAGRVLPQPLRIQIWIDVPLLAASCRLHAESAQVFCFWVCSKFPEAMGYELPMVKLRRQYTIHIL